MPVCTWYTLVGRIGGLVCVSRFSFQNSQRWLNREKSCFEWRSFNAKGHPNCDLKSGNLFGKFISFISFKWQSLAHHWPDNGKVLLVSLIELVLCQRIERPFSWLSRWSASAVDSVRISNLESSPLESVLLRNFLLRSRLIYDSNGVALIEWLYSSFLIVLVWQPLGALRSLTDTFPRRTALESVWTIFPGSAVVIRRCLPTSGTVCRRLLTICLPIVARLHLSCCKPLHVASVTREPCGVLGEFIWHRSIEIRSNIETGPGIREQTVVSAMLWITRIGRNMAITG